MAREDRGVEDEAAKSGGWRADGSRLVGGWLGWVGEADCTRCAVRLTACALRRRPTTLLFEKGREDGGTEGRRGDGWNGRARGGGGDAGGKGRWRVWVAAVAAIPEAPASASAARHESTEDETREKERLREGQEKRDTEKEKRREGQEERRRERKTERPQNE